MSGKLHTPHIYVGLAGVGIITGLNPPLVLSPRVEQSVPTGLRRLGVELVPWPRMWLDIGSRGLYPAVLRAEPSLPLLAPGSPSCGYFAGVAYPPKAPRSRRHQTGDLDDGPLFFLSPPCNWRGWTSALLVQLCC